MAAVFPTRSGEFVLLKRTSPAASSMPPVAATDFTTVRSIFPSRSTFIGRRCGTPSPVELCTPLANPGFNSLASSDRATRLQPRGSTKEASGCCTNSSSRNSLTPPSPDSIRPSEDPRPRQTLTTPSVIRLFCEVPLHRNRLAKQNSYRQDGPSSGAAIRSAPA